ncbi:uncharacterized protein LOC131640544 [Vicia villosa]|uniref:uncharacterized protein LOC131640544 n=1 Tax=Vicia villosa TaxID=3911 RepID=UPI00273CA3C4|nr:uncharacterized protein LOC131640544 [Vicia villosa]
MEAEEILNLFDTFWFGHQSSLTSTGSHENKHHQSKQESSKESKLSRIRTNHTRSMSDELNNMTAFKHESLSPKSVLFETKLHTIPSGKDVTDYKEAENQTQLRLQVSPKKNIVRNRRRKRESKSLSDLEFEEVKGFMDLGFVFSEEDKDSSLVSIIPGLQRLGKNDKDEDEEEDSSFESMIQRPYLSEAWEVHEWRKKEKPLMNWKIPAPTNDVDMKYSLKCWAHNVASTVK